MIHSLVPWRDLTRAGVPPMKVVRLPLEVGEVIVPVGETLDPELFPHAIRASRLRQFYEARRLEPVDAPATSQQFYRERAEREQAERAGEVITPITPVASRIVADLPSVDVPDLDTKRRKGGR